MAGSSPEPGDPFPGLSAEQQALFDGGEEYFVNDLKVTEGLGPVYIEKSCLACHALGGIGGGDPLESPNHFVQRFGTTNLNGTYNNLAALGGDVLQTQSITNDPGAPGCTVAAETIPPVATIHALRNPLPLFGLGLIAAIPEATILAGARTTADADGVLGRANLIGTSPNQRPGRFGWKAQTVDLAPFNAAAANGTMGLTSIFSPAEQKPQGVTIQQTPGTPCSNVELGAAPSDNPTLYNDQSGDFIREITAWEVMLAPVRPKRIEEEARRGQRIFTEIGCAKCHTPEMTTGANFQLTRADGTLLSIEAVNNKRVRLYSDLLLHDMGPELDEGVTMGQAKGSEFRTAPLWGIRLREHFLHDGSAGSIHEAIEAHGGEAEIIRDRYINLRSRDQDAIGEFLDKI